MRAHHASLVAAALALTLVWGLSSVAVAQQNKPSSEPSTAQEGAERATERSTEPDRPDVVAGAITTDIFRPLRASKLIGMRVQNKEGEKLGDVHDIVLDAHGHVRYLALSFGGFLNIGDKLFAVPWEALTLKTDRDDDSDRHLVVNVDKDVLKRAPGFDQDKWPNTATASFWIAVDKHYGVERRAYRGETGRQTDDKKEMDPQEDP